MVEEGEAFLVCEIRQVVRAVHQLLAQLLIVNGFQGHYDLAEIESLLSAVRIARYTLLSWLYARIIMRDGTVSLIDVPIKIKVSGDALFNLLGFGRSYELHIFLRRQTDHVLFGQCAAANFV